MKKCLVAIMVILGILAVSCETQDFSISNYPIDQGRDIVPIWDDSKNELFMGIYSGSVLMKIGFPPNRDVCWVGTEGPESVTLEIDRKGSVRSIKFLVDASRFDRVSFTYFPDDTIFISENLDPHFVADGCGTYLAIYDDVLNTWYNILVNDRRWLSNLFSWDVKIQKAPEWAREFAHFERERGYRKQVNIQIHMAK